MGRMGRKERERLVQASVRGGDAVELAPGSQVQNLTVKARAQV